MNQVRVYVPNLSKIEWGWTRDPFNGTWDFRMSFLVSLPATLLVYGNSRKLQNRWHMHLNLKRFQDSVENFMFLSHTAQRPLLPLGLAIFPETIQRHEIKNRLAVCWKKSWQFTWWTCVSTAPSSDHLSIEFLAWWLFTSLLCFQWSFSNWVISFEALTNLTTHSHTLFQTFCLDTFLYEAWHWHHFEGFLKQDSFPIQSLGSILTQGDPQGNITSKISKIHYDSHNECYLSDELWRNATFSPRKKLPLEMAVSAPVWTPKTSFIERSGFQWLGT